MRRAFPVRIVARCFVAAVLLSLIGPGEGHGVPPKGPPITFADGAPSVDALMDQLLDALARQDEAALTRLRVSKEEYTRIIMPGQIKEGQDPPKPDQKVNDFAWSLLNTKSLYFSQNLIKEFGGRTSIRKGVRFTRPPLEYAWYRAFGEVRLTVEDPEDKRQYQLSSGWIAEVGGKYKFIGFEFDDD
jgi:hypothetical protein